MSRTRIFAVAATATLLLTGFSAQSVSAAVTHYANCTAMHKVYKHGVGKPGAHDHVASGKPVTTFKVSATIYNANKGLDRDHDGIACEAK